MNSGNKGIVNHGNTCYLNSVIQALTHLLFFHPLNKKLKKDIDFSKDKYDLMRNWLQVNHIMWDNKSGENLNILPYIKVFINTIKSENLFFQNFNQNDCEEFITLFFDMIHKILKKDIDCDITDTEEDKSWEELYKNDYSLIVDKFYSQIKIENTCKNCNNKLIKYDPVMLIQLPINDKTKNINDSIYNFCKKETIDDWKCDKCDIKTQCENIYEFKKFSDFLIIQLKRYNIRGKKNNFIEYSDYLNLEKFINKEGYVYKLISIIVHSGGLNSGHYYSFCYNLIDNKWRLYNDESVKEIDINTVLNQNAYCLFYKKIDT